MSAVPDRMLNKKVARALADSEHLRIDPSRLEDVSGYSIMIGGFGTVRVAKLDDDIVAVKELRITGTPEDRVRFSVRFARELRVWSRLDHPNLLKLSGFYMDHDISIAQFICPFYTHGHIRKYIDAHNPDYPTRLGLAEDTAMGLHYLHDLKIVHGDIKELNVLVDPAPRALVCDYGLSKIVDPDGTGAGLTTSSQPISIHFASPELLDGSLPDLASDVWAWGCLFLKIILDVGPYQGTTDIACIRKIAQGIPPADTSMLTMPAVLGDMVQRCWDPDPLARPSVSQCIDTIEFMKRQDRLAGVPREQVSSWDASSQISVQIIKLPHHQLVTSVAFSPDGSFLASAPNRGEILFWTGEVLVWETESGALTKKLDGTGLGCLSGATFSPDGMHLVCISHHRGIAIWDLALTSEAITSRSYTPWPFNQDRPSLFSTVRSVAFSPDGSLLALASKKGELFDIRDGKSWKLLFHMTDTFEVLHDVAFSPDGKWLASSSGLGIKLWYIPTAMFNGTLARGLPVPRVRDLRVVLNLIAFSPDGRWIACTGGRIVWVWDVTEWEAPTRPPIGANESPPTKILELEDIVSSIAFSPDGTRLACGVINGTISIWDTISWTRTMSLKGHGRGQTYVAFSPDGTKIASSSDDKTVRIWQATPAAANDPPPET